MAPSLALSAPRSIKAKFPAVAGPAWKPSIRAIPAPPAPTADPLERLGMTQTVARGRALFEDGDPADYFYKVVSGTVRLFKFLVDGRRQIAGFFLPGDFFGWTVADNYAYSSEAVDNVTVMRFPRRAVEALVESHPPTARRLIACLSTDLTAAQEQMVVLGRKTAEERLATFLAMMVKRTGAASRSGALELSMTRSDIADYLGLTVETVCRTIHALKASGTIASAGAHNITILRRQRLDELAECGNASLTTH